MKKIQKHYITIKKGVSKNRIAEPFWCSRYKFSPYQACQHGCLYCDGRAEKYYVEGEFERDIRIRKNLPEIMERELRGIREKGIISGGSGVSDIYQPVEREEKITRSCAELIRVHKLPAAVATKSGLIMRDGDIWTDIAAQSGFIFMTSLVTADDSIRAEFEPGASTVEERLRALEFFKRAGAAVGVLAMPLLPGICDSEASIAALYERLMKIPVDFVIPGGLTLRPGRQKEIYFNHIAEKMPELEELYGRIYAECRASGNTVYDYRRGLFDVLSRIHEGLGVPWEIPHRIYKNMLTKADEVSVLLQHMSTVYETAGVKTKRLDESTVRYRAWLDDQRRHFNRSRSLPPEWVDETLFFITENGELERILDNGKLFGFLKEVILKDKTFDYVKRELV